MPGSARAQHEMETKANSSESFPDMSGNMSSRVTPYAPSNRYVYPPDASMSLTAPYKEHFSAMSHSKHQGREPQTVQTNIMHLISDRDPELVMERQERLNSHKHAMEADPGVFKGKKTTDSFEEYMQAANIMKDVLGDSRQIRDPYDRCPPEIGYSYSRVPKYIDDRPDSYDYDDKWLCGERTRGYSPGHVRSLSPPPKEKTAWMGKLEKVDSTVSFDEQSYRQLFTRGQPVLETRFSSIALSREWSRYRSRRLADSRARREERERAERARQENLKIRNEVLDSIDLFERNQGKRPIDSDDEDD